jgi:PTH1 family peptidyl-tRNA hydrolase
MSQADERFVVVGLGNPGPKYATTRHNLGYRVVSLLAERMAGRFKVLKLPSTRVEVVEGRLAGHSVVLVRPLSYMNDSGGPVAGVARYYKVPPEQVVIVHDELDLPFGSMRLKRGGGDAGHNGLRSITAALGLARIQPGPRRHRPPARPQERRGLCASRVRARRARRVAVRDRPGADAVEALVSEGLETAQNEYND